MTDEARKALVEKVARAIVTGMSEDPDEMIGNIPFWHGFRLAAEDALSLIGEEMAKVVDAHAILDTVDGPVLMKRTDGDRSGLAYAAAIRALIPHD